MPMQAVTIKQQQQTKAIDKLFAVFPSNATDRAKVAHLVQKDSWTPSDGWQINDYIAGLAHKHAINLSYKLSSALQCSFQSLKLSAKQSVKLTRELQNHGKNKNPIEDPWITQDNLADMVQLLIYLSRPADVTTHTFAHLLLDPERSSKTTYLTAEQRKKAERAEWNRILLEDPLEEDGVDSDGTDSSVLSVWSNVSQEKDGDLSDSDQEDRRRYRQTRRAARNQGPTMQLEDEWQADYDLRALELQEVGSQRYWAGKRDVSELHSVREAILALMGHSGYLFERGSTSSMALRQQEGLTLNETMTSQLNIIANTSSTLLQLRLFVEQVRHSANSSTEYKTRSASLEAFAEQVSHLLDRTTTWCSEYDCDLATSLTGAPSGLARANRDVTLAIFCAEAEKETTSLHLVADLMHEIGLFDRSDDLSSTTCALLNSLQSLLAFSTMEGSRVDTRLQDDLARCFLAAAEPWWLQVCTRVGDGVNFQLARHQQTSSGTDNLASNEGIIERNEKVQTLDSRFWKEGYHLCHGGIPAFLLPLAGDVLNAGKSVGLLEALGVDDVGEVQTHFSLARLLGQEGSHIDRTGEGGQKVVPSQLRGLKLVKDTEPGSLIRQALFGVTAQSASDEKVLAQLEMRNGTTSLDSIISHDDHRRNARRTALLEPDLSRRLYDHLEPTFSIIRKRLHNMLVSTRHQGGCDLHAHLKAIQGLYLMRQGPEMAEWCDLVFDKLHRSAPFETHYLNATFRDATLPINEHDTTWIDSGLIQFYSKSSSSFRALEDIEVDYEVPWPVSYYLTPPIISAYRNIFTLLLQARRARCIVSSLLKRKHQDSYAMRKFWALRRKADWIMRVLEEYLTRDVVQLSVEQLWSSMDDQLTFDSLINGHEKSVERMLHLCFLQQYQQVLKETVQKVFELCVRIIGTYETTFGELTGANTSRRRRRRKRRGRRARAAGASSDTEDEDANDEKAEVTNPEADVSVSFSFDASASWIEQRYGFSRTVEKQTKELKQLVEKLKGVVDEQIGRCAASKAEPEMREKLQELLYALDDWR